jgi:hypothetical protein
MMSTIGEWPRDNDRYVELLDGMEGFLDTALRFPALPFRSKLGNLDICQYSHAIEESFEPVLQSLVDTYGDDLVTVATFDPEPLEYQDHYGTFGAFTISGRGISETYWSAVAQESTGELLFSANVVAQVGSSGRWAVWAERSWDLAIIMSDRAGGPWLSCGVDFVPAEVALENFTEPDFKEPLKGNQRATFLRNVQGMGLRQVG